MIGILILAISMIQFACSKRGPVKNEWRQPPQVNAFEPVKQMLAIRCAPCHIPGGKMYERLPFDNPDVVSSHMDGISRRLKSDEDRLILQQWVDQTADPTKN